MKKTHNKPTTRHRAALYFLRQYAPPLHRWSSLRDSRPSTLPDGQIMRLRGNGIIRLWDDAIRTMLQWGLKCHYL